MTRFKKMFFVSFLGAGLVLSLIGPRAARADSRYAVAFHLFGAVCTHIPAGPC